jgi:hypothetical protein
MRLVTAPAKRAWMDATHERFANRCLPLLIANQAGWFVLNSHDLRVRWNGGTSRSDLALMYFSGERPYPAVSAFGFGILTFHIPYLFRTTPGYNLLARGPANLPKDGAAPIEGLIETDWSVATFTMSWQITRRDETVVFDEGEPICMIVPQRRGELERVRPRIRPLAEEPRLAQSHVAWSRSRTDFSGQMRTFDVPNPQLNWQKHYFRGEFATGETEREHQLKLALREFDGAGPVPGRRLTSRD